MLANIKRSLLCISAISCMSLYASTIAAPIIVNNPITIGDYVDSNTKVATRLTNTDDNYWSTEEDNTYVFNRDKGKNDKHWIPKNTVTIDEDYTLKLKTTGYTSNPIVLYCLNTFTNNGNVTIDNYCALTIDYRTTASDPISDSTNNGTININKGILGLWYSTKLNNTGTITLKGGSHVMICDNSTLSNTGTITLTGSSYIFSYIHIRSKSTLNNAGTITSTGSGRIRIYMDSTLNNTGTITAKGSSHIYIDTNTTLNNTGTIDISNITDLSKWCSSGTFKLGGGSTFILPKSITNKIDTSKWSKPITLNGTSDNKVNIVIPKDCEYIKDIGNNKKGVLFSAIQRATGFTFDGKRNNVKFGWQTSIYN